MATKWRSGLSVSDAKQIGIKRVMLAHEMRTNGMTFREIGERFSVSRERARQMAAKGRRLSEPVRQE